MMAGRWPTVRASRPRLAGVAPRARCRVGFVPRDAREPRRLFGLATGSSRPGMGPSSVPACLIGGDRGSRWPHWRAGGGGIGAARVACASRWLAGSVFRPTRGLAQVPPFEVAVFTAKIEDPALAVPTGVLLRIFASPFSLGGSSLASVQAQRARDWPSPLWL